MERELQNILREKRRLENKLAKISLGYSIEDVDAQSRQEFDENSKFIINYYPLTNEVAKGYSNATVCPSFGPSFRSILVNTLESTSFNGF